MARARVDWIGREAELRGMVAAGKLLRDLAAHFGCSRQSAQKAMHRIGLRIDPVAVDRARRETCARINAMPDRRERVAAGMARRYAIDPTYREKLRAATAARWQRPGYRDDVIPKIRAYANSEEGKRLRSKGGKSNAIIKLAWCPEHLKDEYRALAKMHGVGRAEARRMIQDDWAGQLRHALRQIAAVAPLAIAERERQRNSLEYQIERVKAGAKLVPALHLSRPVSPDRSLTGNATGMCA